MDLGEHGWNMDGTRWGRDGTSSGYLLGKGVTASLSAYYFMRLEWNSVEHLTIIITDKRYVEQR